MLASNHARAAKRRVPVSSAVVSVAKAAHEAGKPEAVSIAEGRKLPFD